MDPQVRPAPRDEPGYVPVSVRVPKAVLMHALADAMIASE
jgi:hypothetical protein